MIARALVFLGPIFNPWLYPIRMASIRSFLIKKKKTLASSGQLINYSHDLMASEGLKFVLLILLLVVFSLYDRYQYCRVSFDALVFKATCSICYLYYLLSLLPLSFIKLSSI